jgi:hypothetical protein
MLRRLFSRRKPAPQPKPSQDVQDQSAIEPGPSQDAQRSYLTPARPLEEFVDSLIVDDNTDGMNGTRLWNLYAEFCDCTYSEMLTRGQFDRRKRAAGIERYRESIGARRWLYRVSPNRTTDRASLVGKDPAENSPGVVEFDRARKAWR